MAKKKPSTDVILASVYQIRADNNALWVNILRLAMEIEPKKTRKIMRDIRKNDKEVVAWLGKL